MTHAGLERPTTHDHTGLERAMTHDLRRTCHDPRRTWCTHDPQWSHDPWRRRREYRHTAWSGGLRWPMMVVACGGTSDRGSSHGGLVMGWVWRWRTQRRNGENRGRRENKIKSRRFFFFFKFRTKLSFLDEIGRFLNLLDLVGIISNLRGDLWNLPILFLV